MDLLTNFIADMTLIVFMILVAIIGVGIDLHLTEKRKKVRFEKQK